MQKGSDNGEYGRTGSMDTAETHMTRHGSIKGAIPPQYQRVPYGYAPAPYHSSRSNLPIKSVVTTSFEEREDRMEHRDASFHHYDLGMRHGRSPPQHGSGREDYMQGMEPPHAPRGEMYHGYGHMEQPHHMGREPPHHDVRDTRTYGREHHPRDLQPIREGDIEGRHPHHEMIRMTREVRVPPSPRGDPSYINRTLSSASSVTSSYRSQGPLKRSFWHHARPGEEFQSLPNEFMPPKRSKVTPPSGRNRDYVVTARRPHPEEVHHPERATNLSRSPGWFNRAMSWEASREDYYQRDPNSKVYTGSWASRSPPSYRDERGGTHWGDAPTMPSPRGRYMGPESGYDMSPAGRWHPSEGHGWGHGIQHRDEAESGKPMGIEARERESFDGEMRRQGTFESGSDGEPPLRFIAGPQITPRDQDHYPSAHMSEMMPNPNADRENNGTLLLALPEDRISLSETLCLVREVRRYSKLKFSFCLFSFN